METTNSADQLYFFQSHLLFILLKSISLDVWGFLILSLVPCLRGWFSWNIWEYLCVLIFILEILGFAVNTLTRTHLLCWVRGAGVCCRGVVFICSSSGNEDLLFFLAMTVYIRLQSAVLIWCLGQGVGKAATVACGGGVLQGGRAGCPGSFTS